MHEPMVWNNLDEATAWLTEATDTAWSVKQVLDAALKNYKRKMQDLHRPNPIRSRLFVGLKHRNERTTCLEAVMPRKTEFGYYEIDTEKVTLDNPSGWVRKFNAGQCNVELTEVDVKQLLLYGEVRVGMAKYPDPEFGTEKKCVLIEPVDHEHIVTLEMVGISGDELKMLGLEFDKKNENGSNEPSLENSNEVTNKKIWSDDQLKSLWEESLLPGSTHEALAKKHKVSRQWVGKLLGRAKQKFSKMSSRSKSNPLDITFHKMK